MGKVTVEIESADDVKVTAKALQDKWNYNLKEQDKIKVKEISSKVHEGVGSNAWENGDL